MKSLSAAINGKVFGVQDVGEWLITLAITFEGYETIYLVRNTTNITFQGNEYIAFPFELDVRNETSSGEMPTVTIKIANPYRIVQSYLEELNGAVGASVVIGVINSDLLTEDYAELEVTYNVLSTSATSQWVSMRLGAPSMARRRFPLYLYRSGRCMWISNFKGAECAYTGSDTSCDGTLTACRRKGNSKRFGAAIGLTQGGLHVV